MRKIVALVGAKGSGKTTAKNIIAEYCKVNNINFKTLAFASKLKEVSAKAFDLDLDYFHSPLKKEGYLEDPISLKKEHLDIFVEEFKLKELYNFDKHGRSLVSTVFEKPRQILQILGTEFLRSIKNSIHVDATLKELPESGLAVFEDVRFINEFEAVEENVPLKDFYPFYIKNLEAEIRNDGHVTETEYRKFKNKCKKIDNNESLRAFEKKVLEELAEVVKC